MNNIAFNYSFFEYIILILLSSGLGLSIRYTLSFAKQSWVTTMHHTLSYCLLPTVTMVITILISGNLALSLGMIGALSIVRFRNPVKSPLELVLFFALITIGIGIAVNFKLSILLTLMINIFIFIFFKIDENLKKKNKSLFSLSFEEGLNFNTLEVQSNVEIPELAKNENLKQFFITGNPKNFNYKIESSNKNDIDNLKEVVKNNLGVLNLDVNYAR
jgi:hypothetical protein